MNEDGDRDFIVVAFGFQFYVHRYIASVLKESHSTAQHKNIKTLADGFFRSSLLSLYVLYREGIHGF